MPLFKTKDQREVLAFRLDVPLTISTGLTAAREFVPGDWLSLDGRVRFVRDSEFRQYYTPAEDTAQALWDTSYDLVVSEERPPIAWENVQEGRAYLFMLRPAATILPVPGVRGVVQGLGMLGLNIRTQDGQLVPVAASAVALIIPEDPETEPCLLQLKASTDPEKAPKPQS